MQKYEAIRQLYEFLVMLKNSKKHLGNENSGWTMEKFMHQNVMEATRATTRAI